MNHEKETMAYSSKITFVTYVNFRVPIAVLKGTSTGAKNPGVLGITLPPGEPIGSLTPYRKCSRLD